MKHKTRRRKIDPIKVLRLLLPVVLFVFLCVVMCVPSPGHDSTVTEEELEAVEAPIVELFSGANVYDL